MATVDWASDSESDNSLDSRETINVDEPRKLTNEEIQGIVDGMRFGLKHNPIQENIIHIHREKTRRKLKQVSVKPSKIPELKKIILQQFYSSIVAAGEAVGVNAAQCIGEPTTQNTLNSIAPDEKLLLQDYEGSTFITEIGPWIDGLIAENAPLVKQYPENRTDYLELAPPVWCPTPDEKGNITWDLVTAVTRHLPVGDLVKITSKSGRTVTATQSKSLLIWENGKFVPKGGIDVKVGDLVPVTCNFPNAPVTTNFLNLKDYLSPKEWVYGTIACQVYKEWLADKRKRRIGFWSGKLDSLPYSRGDGFIDAFRLGVIKSGIVYPKKNITCVKSTIPEKIPLDYNFGLIVGLYLAEGWSTNTFTGISNNDETILDIVRSWCDSLKITHHTVTTISTRFENAKSTDLKIHSVLIARLFKKWMGTGSENKKVPIEAYAAPKDFARGILNGYFAGDGCVNKAGSLDMSSVSKDLIIGISVLCSRFGIVGRIAGHQQKKNNVNSPNIKYTHTLSIRNSFAVKWAKNIGSCHPEKEKLMKSCVLERKYKKPTGLYWTIQQDVILDPITRIDLVPATEFVYDLTVPVTTNFSLWNGLNCSDTFHHSGISAKNVTLGFPRARELFNATKSPSNPTCTIYFTRDNETPEALHKVADRFPEATIEDLLLEWKVYEPEDYDLVYWHTAWFRMHPDFGELTEDDWCLRLKFDVGKLYERNLTIKDVTQRLMETYADIRCIYSPLNLGILDVIVNCADISISGARTGELAEIADDYQARQFYMNKIVSPKLRGQAICGITGITELYRRKARVDESFGGIPLKKEIASRLKNEEEWIIDTDGTNLSEVLTQPGVDSCRTLSNDMWEIANIFGIEAARLYLFIEFMNIVGGGGTSINPVHIQVLVDKMTYTGSIRAIARFGVETAQYDPIARATFEEVMSQIITSAIFSEKDKLNGISSNIVLGTKINAGTGRIEFDDIPLKVVTRKSSTETDKIRPPTATKLPRIVTEDI